MHLSLAFADPVLPSLPLHLVPKDEVAAWLSGQPGPAQAWLEATGFEGALGDVRVMPDARGRIAGAAMGMGDAEARARGRFHVARAAAALPAGVYRIATPLSAEDASEAALGWLLAGYRFDRYRRTGRPQAALLQPPAGVDARRIEILAAAEALTRDLINTPASDMGPDELEVSAAALAAEFGAHIAVTRGDDLLSANLPMIHAVGRASARAPRLIDLAWGEAGPRLTLVGKGVCFDTGGLDIKPAASMGLMKKDMGGAATVLGLARAVMALGWPVRLRVLVPAVENAIGANAFRPQDVLVSRKGLTVEVNNTDAEGRLILADALALADEEAPEVLVAMATLTGAARVALGPDLAPFYTDDDGLAAALEAGSRAARDPLWRLPFWTPYEAEIEPGIADLDNAPSGGMAGSVTAALFLRRFVGRARRFVHFDIYGWQPKDAPGRTKGGVGQGARALAQALPGVLGIGP